MRLLFAFLVLSLESCYAARILGLCPMPTRSHGILLERLLREVANKGHQITYITASSAGTPIPNLKVIEVPGIRDALTNAIMPSSNGSNASLLKVRKMNPWLSLGFRHKMAAVVGEHILSNPSVQELLASDEKFDLIFGEIMMDESILAGLSFKYKAPIVAFATFLPNQMANYLVGNPAPSSYIPEPFLGYSAEMTFWERVNNLLFSVATEISHAYNYLTAQDEIMRKYFGSDLPYIGDILMNTSVVLVNSHHSLAFPRPNLPNMIDVAGVHINEPKALPENLKKYMDESKNGVVFFSLGSNVKSSDMPPETISSFLKAFAKIPENVLWKFEESLTDLPSNVKVMKWLPQSDLLDHPNLKLFITHGGMLSTTEAMAKGVPIVGIPIMGDQHVNMKLTELAGWGLTLQYDKITEDSLYSIVREVIDNPKYKATALKKAKIFNDNPRTPLETSVWWIEYVLRHNGAFHLRSAFQDLAWYESYSLDVIVLLSTVFVLLAFVNYYVVAMIIRKLFCQKKKEKVN